MNEEFIEELQLVLAEPDNKVAQKKLDELEKAVLLMEAIAKSKVDILRRKLKK